VYNDDLTLLFSPLESLLLLFFVNGSRGEIHAILQKSFRLFTCFRCRKNPKKMALSKYLEKCLKPLSSSNFEWSQQNSSGVHASRNPTIRGGDRVPLIHVLI